MDTYQASGSGMLFTASWFCAAVRKDQELESYKLWFHSLLLIPQSGTESDQSIDILVVALRIYFGFHSQPVNTLLKILVFPLDLLSSLHPTLSLVRRTSLDSLPSGFWLGLSNGRHQQEIGKYEGRDVRALRSLSPFLSLFGSGWIPTPKATASAGWLLYIFCSKSQRTVPPRYLQAKAGNSILLFLGGCFTISCR